MNTQEHLSFIAQAIAQKTSISGWRNYCATYSVSSFLIERLSRETDFNKDYVQKILECVNLSFEIDLTAEQLIHIAATTKDYRTRQILLTRPLIEWQIDNEPDVDEKSDISIHHTLLPRHIQKYAEHFDFRVFFIDDCDVSQLPSEVQLVVTGLKDSADRPKSPETLTANDLVLICSGGDYMYDDKKDGSELRMPAGHYDRYITDTSVRELYTRQNNLPVPFDLPRLDEPTDITQFKTQAQGFFKGCSEKFAHNKAAHAAIIKNLTLLINYIDDCDDSRQISQSINDFTQHGDYQTLIRELEAHPYRLNEIMKHAIEQIMNHTKNFINYLYYGNYNSYIETYSLFSRPDTCLRNNLIRELECERDIQTTVCAY